MFDDRCDFSNIGLIDENNTLDYSPLFRFSFSLYLQRN